MNRQETLPLDWEHVERTSRSIVRPEHRPNLGRLSWLYVDLDGTLARSIWTPENPTSEVGDPLWTNIAKMFEVTVKHGLKVVIHTARPWADVQVIEDWLKHYDIPYHSIQCGKPLGIAYVDDRAISAFDDDWTPRELRD